MGSSAVSTPTRMQPALFFTNTNQNILVEETNFFPALLLLSSPCLYPSFAPDLFTLASYTVSMSKSTVELNPLHRIPSLGTKSHWDSVYSQEKATYDSSQEHGDSQEYGDCWYSSHDAEARVVDFVTHNFAPGHTGGVCDLGTGNGHMLFELSHHGLHNLAMVGIDYSPASISFAKDIAASELDLKGIKFQQSDFLNDNDSFVRNHLQSFGLIIDKGTLDAIFLSQATYNGCKGEEIYPKHVHSIMKPGAVLVITCSNFTETELIATVTKSGLFEYWTHLEYPTFEFAGHVGQAICTIAFKRSN